MREEAQLLIHRKPVGLDAYVESYEWVGSASAPILIDRHILNRLLPHCEQRWPKQIELGGYPLKLIPDSEWDLFHLNRAMYARVDGVNWVSWFRYALERLIRRLFLKTYCRLILTLSVWGLAKIDMGCRPSWRDIGRK